ncbi:MAG TPA: nucleotidyltransferase domain-containing protein [Actinospica sp.]|nr:nucleotidyltransferase domain-containing protein [Actinospica sp.]
MDSKPSTPYQSDLDAYLAALDRVLPTDAVEGVYLIGSIALGDYRHGQSDLDLLTLTTRALSEDELTALDQMHKTLEDGSQPHKDAQYLAREFVGKLPPEDAAGQGYVVDGEFQRGVSGQELVVWATLAAHGLTVRGPEASSLDAAPDAGAFKAWNRGNLEGYWRTQALQVRLAISERDPEEDFRPYFAVWFGSGPGRLHRTIATGEIISKSACIDYTAELFPEYAELLKRVKASRAGDASVAFTMNDGRLLSNLVEEVCDSAKRLP